MKDHIYFSTPAFRGRILGPFLTRTGYASIIRSVHTESGWMKPVKNATEQGDPTLWSVLDRYPSVNILGRRFPTFPEAALDRVLNPFDWSSNELVSPESHELMKDLQDKFYSLRSSQIGLGGSRLYGAESSHSDIDLVLAEDSHIQRRDLFYHISSEAVTVASFNSRRAIEFFKLYSGFRQNVLVRNIFTFYHAGRTIDVASQLSNAVRALALAAEDLSSEALDRVVSAEIIDDTFRGEFPVCLEATSDAFHCGRGYLLTFDPVASYMTIGDEVTLRADLKHDELAGYSICQCKAILSIK